MITENEMTSFKMTSVEMTMDEMTVNKMKIAQTTTDKITANEGLQSKLLIKINIGKLTKV